MPLSRKGSLQGQGFLSLAARGSRSSSGWTLTPLAVPGRSHHLNSTPGFTLPSGTLRHCLYPQPSAPGCTCFGHLTTGVHQLFEFFGFLGNDRVKPAPRLEHIVNLYLRPSCTHTWPTLRRSWTMIQPAPVPVHHCLLWMVVNQLSSITSTSPPFLGLQTLPTYSEAVTLQAPSRPCPRRRPESWAGNTAHHVKPTCN